MRVFLVMLVVVAALMLGWTYYAERHSAAARQAAGRGGIPAGTGFGVRGLPSGPTTTVGGMVRMAGGTTHSAHVDLVRVGPTGSGRVAQGTEALGDGRFSFSRVAADRYWVVAYAEVDADPMKPGDGPVQQLYGLAEAVSDGEQPGRVGVALRPSSTVAGRITLEPASASAARDFKLLNVSLTPIDTQAKAGIASGNTSTTLGEDGVFTIAGVPPGRYTLDVTPSTWTIDAVVVADQDRLDRPFQIGTGEQLRASLALTAQPNMLTGMLRDGSGHPLALGLVTLFAIDGEQRTAHRRVQLVRTDVKGLFRFDGLPSGDYFLAAADGFDPAVWRTEGFFTRLTSRASRVTLAHGRAVVQDVRAQMR